MLSQKTPVGMFNPVFQVELAFEFFNKLLSVFALEPAEKSSLPLSAFKHRHSGFLIYDGPVDRTIQQISEFISEKLEALQAYGLLIHYNFNRQVNKPDHRPEAHCPVLVRAQVRLLPAEKMEKTDHVLLVGRVFTEEALYNDFQCLDLMWDKNFVPFDANSHSI